MKSFILSTALMAATALTASAQYVIDPELPIPVATQATDVDDYGFTANWNPVVDYDLSLKPLGYYVPVYATKTAQEEGDKFYLINTDFSFLTSSSTVDNPSSDISTSNYSVVDYLKEPSRPYGWKVVNAGKANGVLCLDCKFNRTYVNGALALCYNDLTLGDGKVHFKFKVRSDGKTKTLSVHLRDISKVPNQNIDSYTISNLTTEWQEVEFTLNGGVSLGDILFQSDDTGDCYSMYLFIDDLQVWQELHKGERGKILYTDDFIKDDLDASSLYFSIGDLYEGEKFAYSVCTYSLEAHSQDSNLVFIDGSTPTGINATEANIDANAPADIYTTGGTLVARGVTGTLPQLAHGVYVVKQGKKTVKVLK